IVMKNNPFKNKKILITAGPTREAIDPVRYISNYSSGKMGYAIAAELLHRGAEVYLVSGPVHLELQHPMLTLVKVNSAIEMDLAACRFFEKVDVAVFAAAVADYRPEVVSKQKIKKEASSFTIKMVKNVDIAYEFGKIKSPAQISVGFALETNDEHKQAIGKLVKKNFNMVVLNSMNDANATFGYDTNKISIIKSDFSQKLFPLKNKKDVAIDIVDEIEVTMSDREKYFIEQSVLEYETMYR
ncbi:MAG: phosphopantothenoylcysteine decarboxylase, partial [Ginsengibacter sp.]